MIRRPTNEQIWKFLIVIAIGLAAGPDVFAALEMRVLLELLGVALFTTAMMAGARMWLLALRTRTRDILVPPPQRALLETEGAFAEKACAALYQVFYVREWLGLLALLMIFGVVLAR